MTAICFFLLFCLSLSAAFHFASKVGPGPTYTNKEDVYGTLTLFSLFACVIFAIETVFSVS